MATTSPATNGAALAAFDYISCSALDVAYSWPDSVFLDPNSPQDCALYCAGHGYTYFTIQSQWCGCDNVLPPVVQNYADTGHADCNFDCNNNCFAGEFCGGFDPNSFAPLFNVYGPGAGAGNPGGDGAAGACSASVTVSMSVSVATSVSTATSVVTTSVDSSSTGAGTSDSDTSPATTATTTGTSGVDATAIDGDSDASTATTATTATIATTATTATTTAITTTNTPMITRTIMSTVTDTITSCPPTKTDCPAGGAGGAITVTHTTSYPASLFVCPDHGTTVYYDPSESALTTHQRYVTVTVEGGRITRTVTSYATLVPVSPPTTLPVKPGGNGTVISPPLVAGASASGAISVAIALVAGIAVLVILGS